MVSFCKIFTENFTENWYFPIVISDEREKAESPFHRDANDAEELSRLVGRESGY